VTVRSAEGKSIRLYRTVQASTAKQAAACLAVFNDEVRDAPPPSAVAGASSVDEAIERFLTEYLAAEKGREDKTTRDYRALHRKWFSPSIGHVVVRDVDAAAIDRIFGQMRRAGLSRSRMNQAKCLYRPFFRWARKRGLTVVDPMGAFELPRSTHVSRERVPPEVDELIVLLEAALVLTPEIAPLLALGAVTGMRRGELVGLRRSRIHWKDQRITVDSSVDGQRVKGTKTGDERTFYVDEATIAMLRSVCDRQDELAVAVGAISSDPFLFSLAADVSRPMPPDYVTKRVATLKSHLGIEEKRPATAALEDEALRLFREPRQPRPAGMTGPAPSGAHSYAEIGRRLNRSERWAAMAVAAAERREAAVALGTGLDFDGSILALRKFTSSELLDAGFNISMVAQRQGHGTQVLARHYSKSRRSSDRRAAEHLGAVVHGSPGPSAA
jgi:integrase